MSSWYASQKEIRKFKIFQSTVPVEKERVLCSATQEFPPNFIEPELSLPHLPDRVIYPYPQPDESNLWPASHLIL